MTKTVTKTNHFISLEVASGMIARYKSAKEEIISGGFRGKEILANSETFSRTAFDAVLAQNGCTGLRIFYGMDDASNVHAIIVGVNDRNEDMLAKIVVPDESTMENEEVDPIIEMGARCPHDCPPPSEINP